ncbi:fatty acyl-CoA reductase 1-like [Dendroctonus ponderosae]|uniref:fatty acyl-CoA reductase 1-like n=1 Tax=Dendroctonus ponderosae TaxID=77166 RepID=UPI0020361801|nr:fatty acyl-CoA reductase 1-like [Dendroctonus ponderosae]
MAATQTIQECFKGKNIFLTGGSGFIGKACIEKFLRSCPDLGKIYILMRPKKGKSLEERLEQITSSTLFEKLKQMYPENLKKIIPIKGDVLTLGLGISDEDRKLLIQDVHFICHTAASVKFDDFLKDAIFTNIRAAREVALLALEMKNIQVFLHVSTTYCNIDGKKIVDEVLYPQHGDWKEAICAAESMDSHTLNVLTQKFMEPFPNTYTYTKQLAEYCINDMLVGKVPAIICRPSVVVSTLVEPFQGWNDNFNGPVGLLLAGGAGILRTVYGDPDVIPDYVSVDSVAKIIIMALWHKAVLGQKSSLSIYQASKYNEQIVKQNYLVETGRRLYWEVPFKNKIWFPGNSMTKYFLIFYINVLLFHVLPALFVDLLLLLSGRSPFLFKLQRKIYIANIAVSHFMLNQWLFVNDNSKRLHTYLPDENKDAFDINQLPLTEDEQYTFYLKSCDYARRYLIKEYDDVTEETRTKTKRMYFLHCLTKFLFYSWMAWIVFYKINVVKILLIWLRNYWNSL